MRSKWTKWIALLLIALMAIGVVVTAVISVGAEEAADIDPKDASAGEITDSSWMAGVSDDTMLSSVTIPGTHDSATQNIILKFILQCQDTTIAQQLENGYRYLDIRAAIDEGKGGDRRLKLIHSIGNCKAKKGLFAGNLYLDAVVEDVYDFLEKNPTETVLFCVKAENGDDPVGEVQSLLYQLIDENPDKWYLQNRIPTIGEVRGKIVLATRFEDVGGQGEMRSGLNFMWEDQGSKEIVDLPYDLSMISENQSLWVQDRYKYNVENKIDALLDGIENCQAGDDTFFLNFSSTSGSGKIGRPKQYANIINSHLLSHPLQSHTSYGIIIVDFGTSELARHIYSSNFQNGQ